MFSCGPRGSGGNDVLLWPKSLWRGSIVSFRVCVCLCVYVVCVCVYGGCWNHSSAKATRVECLRATLKGNRAFLGKDQQEGSVLGLAFSPTCGFSISHF